MIINGTSILLTIAIAIVVTLLWRNAGKNNNFSYSHDLAEPLTEIDQLEFDSDAQFESIVTMKPNITSASVSRSKPAPIIVLYVMAKPGEPFQGYELLQSLLAAGLRYDNQLKIFNYYPEEISLDNKTLWFSVAQAKEPGIFYLDDMGASYCDGLSIFMDLSDITLSGHTFDRMLNVAHHLASDLNGVLLDSKRQPIDRHFINESKQIIFDHFESISA